MFVKKQMHMHAHKYVCMRLCVHACSCHNVQVDLQSVWYPLCASTFSSQDATWNMAVSLAIKSLGKIMQLNCFDPLRIKRTGRFYPTTLGRRQNKAKDVCQIQTDLDLCGNTVWLLLITLTCLCGMCSWCVLEMFCIFLLVRIPFNLVCIFMPRDQNCSSRRMAADWVTIT